MKARFFRHADGAAVFEDEAMVNGTLRTGYRMSVGLVMSDAARAVAAIGGSVNFVDHLPSHLLPQLTRLADAAASNEVFRAQTAATMARTLADEITRTQSAGAASAQAAQYVSGIADRAQARAAALRGIPAPQTTTDKDTVMTLNDSLAHVPGAISTKVLYNLGDMQSNDRARVQNGINQMAGLVAQLEHGAAGPAGLFGDANLSDAGAAIPGLVAGLRSEISQAETRLANLHR